MNNVEPERDSAVTVRNRCRRLREEFQLNYARVAQDLLIIIIMNDNKKEKKLIALLAGRKTNFRKRLRRKRSCDFCSFLSFFLLRRWWGMIDSPLLPYSAVTVHYLHGVFHVHKLLYICGSLLAKCTVRYIKSSFFCNKNKYNILDLKLFLNLRNVSVKKKIGNKCVE